LWRGVTLALAVAAKFAPLPLLPLFASGEVGLGRRVDEDRGSQLRPLAIFSAAFTATIGVMLVLPALDPGVATFYERTLDSQIDRTSPFSVWGQNHSLEWLQTAVKAFAVGLAILVAFVPRRRSLPQIAALAAAVMIAVELAAEHWFYLYIPWFCALALPAIAFSTSRSSSATAAVNSVASGPGRSLAKASASER
jgi:hypothetical protein